MAARFFLDETDLLLAKRLAVVRPGDVVHPGHPDLHEVPRGSTDPHWLPIVGERKLVVITRDKRIRRKPVEQQLWVDHGLRGIVLTGRDSQSTRASLALLEGAWKRIETEIVNNPAGPWMISLSSAGLRPIELRAR